MEPLLIGTIVDIGKTLIDRMFPDKEKQSQERAAAEMALYQAQVDGTIKQTAQQLSAIIAEAQSNDPWTSRARPSFLYVMYILILMAIPMGFIAAFKPALATAVSLGMSNWLNALPDSLYSLFGVGYLGYTGARTLEKNKVTSAAAFLKK